MTKINVTKSQLLGKHNEINSWKRNDSILSYWNQPKINEFYNNNRLRINTILEDFEAINMKYFVHEKTEEGKWKVVTEGEGAERKQVCHEGMTIEGHTEEIQKFLAEQTIMEI
jgi:hypothetical protein